MRWTGKCQDTLFVPNWTTIIFCPKIFPISPIVFEICQKTWKHPPPIGFLCGLLLWIMSYTFPHLHTKFHAFMIKCTIITIMSVLPRINTPTHKYTVRLPKFIIYRHPGNINLLHRNIGTALISLPFLSSVARSFSIPPYWNSYESL